MEIGLSLPYSYISENNKKSDEIFISSLGSIGKALAGLNTLIDYIEVSNFDTLAPADQIVTAVRTIWKYGLKVSLHPSLPENVQGKELEEIYPWLVKILPEIHQYQPELMLNVHALAAKEGDLENLRNMSIANLKDITGLINKRDLPLKVAVEINRLKNEIDPCTSYSGVFNILEAVNSPVLGICWDIGHSYVNFLNGLIPRIPPAEFLKNLTHTHIHDISLENNTHWPLTTGRVPLVEYIQLLKKNDYNGLFILELQPGKFSSSGSTENLILESINILKKAVK